MEKTRGWEQDTLINELTQGLDLAKQLKNHLDPFASPESCDCLIERILSSYDKALSMLNSGDLAGGLHEVAGIFESPQPLAGGSPSSEASGRDFKDQCHKDVYKKRKTLPRWTEQVRVCSETGLGTLDDGYSWRKYGQKDILGASFPRSYYRCTHRNVQGCLATKQVQRSDEDTSVIEITYRGRHTCIQASQVTPSLVSIVKEGPKQNSGHNQPAQLEDENQSQSQEMLFNYGTGLRMRAEDLAIMGDMFPSFSFPSTPVESENVESYAFPESLKENNFMGSESPQFFSPTTSESNLFSLLPCQIDDFGFSQKLQHSESDIAEILSAPTSVTNSPIENLEYFSLDQVDFDPNFQFDTSEFFS